MSNETNEVVITKMTMQLMDDWGLEPRQIITLLALPSSVRTRHLEKFRNGDAFPANKATMIRIEHIAGIADALRTTYPRNMHMASRWLRTPHRRFKNQTPIETMLESETGLLSVRSELDCAYAWDRSGS
ncbi:MAG: MbcA/ParS/Xre antitoxin family protein [Pseudomonadota bacterium]